MNIHLTHHEARVIGCLIEKAITTPEQYLLSLNALTNACNQKSSREPVLDLDEATVQQTLDELIKRHLAIGQSGFGSRVTKYQHRFCNSDFGGLQFSPQELGMLCVLLLRGPQTPGELRTRTDRLCRFNDMDEVEVTLQHLMKREDGPFVAKFTREAGKRESRYGQLFCDAVLEYAEGTSVAPEHTNFDQERLHQLEQLVAELRTKIDQLKQQVEALALR